MVLTNDQIYFRCGHRIWSEDTCFDDDPSHPGQEDSRSTDLSLQGYKQSAAETGGRGICDILDYYWHILVAYSLRSLTKEDDAISAITGALMPLAARVGGGLLQGLPIGAWDIVILFQNKPENQGDPWTGWERRCGFPSWSWAGWKGKPLLAETAPDWSAAASSPEAKDFECADEFLRTLTWIVWYRYQHGRTTILSEASETPVQAKQFNQVDPTTLKERAKKLFPTLETG